VSTHAAKTICSTLRADSNKTTTIRMQRIKLDLYLSIITSECLIDWCGNWPKVYW